MNTPQHLTVTAGRRLMPAGEFKRVMGGMSEMTRWRHQRACIGPAPVKLNGRNFYFEDEVGAYLEELAASRQGPGQQSIETGGHEKCSAGVAQPHRE